MKLTLKQIEQIKSIRQFNLTNFHGNRKKIGHISVSLFTEIVRKKQARSQNKYFERNVIKSKAATVRELIKDSLNSKGTNYFKIMIEGQTGIYYAHPGYKHRDYNKSRLFNKTEETLKLMHLFNSFINKKINQN